MNLFSFRGCSERLSPGENEDSVIDDLILQRQQAQEEKNEELQREFNQLSSKNVDLKFQVSRMETLKKFELT